VLHHGHDFTDGHALVSSLSSDVSNVQVLGSKSKVQSLREEVGGGLRGNHLNNREHDWHKLVWKEWWQVVTWSVDPSVQEVVVTVWQTGSLVEEVHSFLVVEVSADVLSQWQVRDVETGVLSLLDPV